MLTCDIDDDGILDCDDPVIDTVPPGMPGLLQYAVDNSVPDSTITLEAGVYTAAEGADTVLNLGSKDVYFVGATDSSGAPATILDGESTRRVLHLYGGQTSNTTFVNTSSSRTEPTHKAAASVCTAPPEPGLYSATASSATTAQPTKALPAMVAEPICSRLQHISRTASSPRIPPMTTAPVSMRSLRRWS